MRRASGFTLIELMITLVIVAILVAVALPSYQSHVIRAVRSQGEQFLTDIAQRQEQYFVDARTYATGIATVSTANMITMTAPDQVTAKYLPPVITTPALTIPAPSYVVKLSPIPGGQMATDGDLYINSLGQRWREVVGGNGTFDAYPTDCPWEKQSCTPQ